MFEPSILLKSLYEYLPTFMNQNLLSADLLPKFTFKKILVMGFTPTVSGECKYKKGCKYVLDGLVLKT